MTTLETRFIDGLFLKTLIVGALSSALGWWLVSLHFAASILLGVLVSAFNMRLIGWVSRRMTRAAARGETAAKRWSLLLGVKLLILAALTFFFIVIVGANVIAYVIGFSTFLVAIVWQLLEHLGREESFEGPQDAMNDGDTESL